MKHEALQSRSPKKSGPVNIIKKRHKLRKMSFMHVIHRKVMSLDKSENKGERRETETRGREREKEVRQRRKGGRQKEKGGRQRERS